MHSSSALVRLGVGLVLGYGLLLAEGSPVNAEIGQKGKGFIHEGEWQDRRFLWIRSL